MPFPIVGEGNSQSLWGQITAPWIVPRILIENGHGAELLTAFERDFPAGTEPFKPGGIMEQQSALAASPYIVLALRDAGREADAEAVRTRALKVATRAGANNAKVMDLLLSARLAALGGDKAEALGHLEQARARGYPHTLNVHANDAILPLAGDPAFAGVAGEARFVAVAQAVEAERAKERGEVR